jgi:hypothetical protein
MRHVCLDEMASAQCRVQTQLSCKHTRSDNTSKLARVVSRGGRMRAAYTKEIEHGGLRFENCAATDGADFY